MVIGLHCKVHINYVVHVYSNSSNIPFASTINDWYSQSEFAIRVCNCPGGGQGQDMCKRSFDSYNPLYV